MNSPIVQNFTSEFWIVRSSNALTKLQKDHEGTANSIKCECPCNHSVTTGLQRRWTNSYGAQNNCRKVESESDLLSLVRLFQSHWGHTWRSPWSLPWCPWDQSALPICEKTYGLQGMESEKVILYLKKKYQLQNYEK